MNKNYIYLMALIGSIMGILGSVSWVYYGTSFIGGWIEGDIQSNPFQLPDNAMKTGLIIAFIQSIITISFFIVTLVKSTPENLENKTRLTGMWFLWVGIGIAVINFFHLIPCILLIVAGTYSIKETKETDDHTTDREIDTNENGPGYIET